MYISGFYTHLSTNIFITEFNICQQNILMNVVPEIEEHNIHYK